MGPADWLVVAVPFTVVLLFAAWRRDARRDGPDLLEIDVADARLAAQRLSERLRRLRAERLALTDAGRPPHGGFSRRLVARPMVPALALQALPAPAPLPVGRATLWRDTSLVLVALAVVGMIALGLATRPSLPVRGGVLGATGTPQVQPSVTPSPSPTPTPAPPSPAP